MAYQPKQRNFLVGSPFFACHSDVMYMTFDYTGSRLATYSRDHQLKIWELKDDGQWKKTASWRPHTTSLLDMSWSHPLFGPIIATCSMDAVAAIIWKPKILNGKIQKPPRRPPPSKRERSEREKRCMVQNGPTHVVKRERNKWEIYFIIYSETPITKVAFAPGFYFDTPKTKVAVPPESTVLRLATCTKPDIVTVYMAPDSLDCECWVQEFTYYTKMRISCIAWSNSTSKLQSPMFAVGSDDLTRYDTGKVMIFELNGQWQKVQTIVSFPHPVYDLAFAPKYGRPYHQLAVASNDVYILQLQARDDQYSMNETRFAIRYIADLTEHNGEVSKVSWGMLGNVVTSVGCDGYMRVWKPNYNDKWECASVTKCKETKLPPNFKNSDDEDADYTQNVIDDDTMPSLGVCSWKKR